MKVRCINKNIADLTLGKVYSVIDQTIDFYAIIDNFKLINFLTNIGFLQGFDKL